MIPTSNAREFLNAMERQFQESPVTTDSELIRGLILLAENFALRIEHLEVKLALMELREKEASNEETN